jgi:hypothetical protein
MYSEFRDTSRTGWKFSYKGSDLVAAAQAKLAEYTRRETEARQEMSKLMADMRVSPTGEDCSKLKSAIENYGTIREQCQVFAHEFARTPDREFNLSLGDVVFFGLV